MSETTDTRDLAVALVDRLAVLYGGASARLQCEEKAQTLGLLARPDEHMVTQQRAQLRGMWYLLAHSIVLAPLPWPEKGRRLAEAEDITPPSLRMLNLDPIVKDNLAADDPIANGFRALIAQLRALNAYQTAVAILRETDQWVLTDWQFGKQLLGLGPDEDTPPEDTGSL
ncbi:hypothetical protein AB0L82_26175 [Nocardia sp. NPDC052001]|uniref:hypothetical protein n=1 Tax=Nocardia sp. NPDC052001 TaxID=3154853 RepID=UPI003433C4B1